MKKVAEMLLFYYMEMLVSYRIVGWLELQAHVLHQYGQSRNESQNAAVPDGAFGHKYHHERIHSSWA